MSQIDDPLEAVKQQYPEESKGPISVMLEVLGPWHPFMGLVNVFKHFASQSQNLRMPLTNATHARTNR